MLLPRLLHVLTGEVFINFTTFIYVDLKKQKQRVNTFKRKNYFKSNNAAAQRPVKKAQSFTHARTHASTHAQSGLSPTTSAIFFFFEH